MLHFLVNDHGYVGFVVITIQAFTDSWIIPGCGSRVVTSAAGTAYLSGAPEFTPVGLVLLSFSLILFVL